ncbi:MAG: LysR family transcriptional regulator [Acidobacteria bacterium]|nr:LysR family transcriptional regulator [Acidobacteriota bacterium]
MDIHQLEHFLAVVDERTFTRAAGRLCRTQPAVSQSIRKLEEELEGPLLARDKHGLILTETGKRLLDYARRMIHLRDEAVRTLGELRDRSSGTLSIASHETAALYLLPGPLRAYARQFQEVRVGVYRSPLDEIPERVLDREVDLGFVAEEPLSRDLHSVHIYSDELILVASPRHPVAARRAVQITELGQEHFVTHHLCTSSLRKILDVFHQHRTPFKVAADLWSFGNIKDFVEQDIGLAIVPRVTVLQSLRSGQLVEVQVQQIHIPRQTYVIFRDPQYMSAAARGLLKILSDFDWNHWQAQKGLQPPPMAARAQMGRLRRV